MFLPIRSSWTRPLAVLALAVLTACGGGGGSANPGGGPPAGGQPPAISSQPSPATVAAGQLATFSAQATGDPAPTHQWERSPDGVAWSAVNGATAATYSFTAVPADQGARFRDRVSNSAGTAVSTAALLTVHYQPYFTTQPASQSVASPAPAVFSMAMSCNPQGSAQWQSSPDGSVWQDLPGATGPSYSTGPTSSAMNGLMFRCVCSNPIGSTISAAATLVVDAPATSYTITASAGIYGRISPSGAVTVAAGGSITFSIIADPYYEISDVKVDGVSVGPVSTYTFTNVTANHTITATFAY